MTFQRLRTKLWLCWATRIVPTYWKVLAWLLWLPHRRLRRSLFREYADWGTPLRTLRAMSDHLRRTYERWEAALRKIDALEAENRELKYTLHGLRSVAPPRPTVIVRPPTSVVIGPFHN